MASAIVSQVPASIESGENEPKSRFSKKPIKFQEEAKTIKEKGTSRSSSIDFSRPPSLKRASRQQVMTPNANTSRRTPSSKPLPMNQGIPRIKITDFDLGSDQYITVEELQLHMAKIRAPYGIDDLADENDEDDFNDSLDYTTDSGKSSPRANSPSDYPSDNGKRSSRLPSEDLSENFSENDYLSEASDTESDDEDFLNDRELEKQIQVIHTKDKDFNVKYRSILRRPASSPNQKLQATKSKKFTLRRKSLSDMDKIKRTKKVNFKRDIFEVLKPKRNKVILKPIKKPKIKTKKVKPTTTTKNGGEYMVSGPQSEDLYNPNAKIVSLPSLTASSTGTARRRRKKGGSNLYPYIHGIQRTVDSRASSAKSSRMPSAATIRSKDDSRIQYEATVDDLLPPKSAIRVVPETSRMRKIRIFRNGDRYFPGLEYAFRVGRDVVNLEGLCDKISDRIGLPRGARYIFGIDGTRKFRLEELEDGGSYIASSDRKFANLAYNSRRPGWNAKYRPKTIRAGRSGSPAVRLAGKSRGDSSDSGNSTGSSNGKSGSKEGRTIKVINTEDRSQEISVLVNMKTVQEWEDVVGDLGQVLKLRGDLRLFTINGQEVKSFSQFKNDYAALDTFFLKPVDNFEVGRKFALSRPNSASTDGTITPRKGKMGEEKRSKSRARTSRSQKSGLRRYASEPSLKDAVDEREDEEVGDGRAVSIVIHGQKRILHPPRHLVTHNPSPPSHTLALDWVYGYRGADTKKNLWVVSTEEILYFVSAVAILYDRKLDIQRHYTEHTEDIQCLALHPTRDIAASGQRATRGARMTAHIRIWSIRSLNTLHVLGEKELGLGVMSVAFSIQNKGQFLLAVDADQEHLLSVWSWETEKVYGKVATHQDFVYGAVFHPLDNNLIIIHGRGLLALWTRRKDGIFTNSLLLNDASNKTITSMEFSSSGDLVTGDSEGKVAVWSVDLEGQYFIKLEFVAHDGPISALQQLSEGTILSGGERDRKIIAWDSDEDFEKVEETRLPELAGGVRSLYPQRPGESDGNFYVGTNRNMILEGSLQRRFNQIVFGHSKQLWGLTVNQIDGIVATAGYDKQIVKWRNNKLDWRIQAQGECVSVVIHPHSTVVAAGTIDGHLIVLNGLTGNHIVTVRVCGSPISCMAYNPTGDTLAIGSQNGSVYLFRSTKDGFVYSRYGRMSGFQPLSGIDWSSSGNYLQTVTSDNDLAFWNLRELALVKNSTEVRNEKWVTQNCPIGYMIHGIWAGKKNSPTQVTVDRYDGRKLLAAGDTDGYLRLYRYPVLSPYAGYHEYKVYTSYLSGVRFSPEEDYLYTIGGTDAALMRWRID